MTKHSLVFIFEDPAMARSRFCRVLEFNYPGTLTKELRSKLIDNILESQEYFNMEIEMDADGFHRTYAFWSIEPEPINEETHVTQEEEPRQ